MNVEQPVSFNFANPTIFENPFDLYQELRERAPVFWMELLSPPGWLLTRHADCVRVLTDREYFGPGPRTRDMYEDDFPEVRQNPHAIDFSVEFNFKAMFMADPPYHTALRGTANRGFFSPKIMQRCAAQTQQHIEGLLDRLIHGQPFDLVCDFAAKIPYVLFDFLDFPQQDRQRAASWIQDTVLFFGGFIADAQSLLRVDQHMREFLAYIQEWIQQRRQNPGSDVLSLMLQGALKHDLPDRDLALIVLTFFGAGHATLVNNITMAVATLLGHPQQLALLGQQPDLWPNAVEECLRFNTPQQILHRKAVKDSLIGHQEIKQGQMLYCVVGAANRDPLVFSQAERFDITRTNAKKHLSHGSGPHYCLGAVLSRLETEIALKALFQRFPDLRFDGKASWIQSHFFRGFESLPLTC